jgi:BASS family bile acid:Na+ symporter
MRRVHAPTVSQATGASVALIRWNVRGLGTTGGILIAIYLVAMMLSVGLGLRDDGRHRRHRRHALGILLRALVFNMIFVPAIALVLTRALGVSSDVAIALLLLAVAPGGRYAPQLTRLAGGQVTMATEQTVLACKLTTITAPLTAKLLLGIHHLQVDEWTLLVDVVMLQLLPLYVGKALARWRGDLARRLERPLRIGVIVIALCVLGAFLADSGLASLELLGDRGWIAVLVLAALVLALGWLLSGPEAAVRRSLVIGGLSRNLALALLLASVAFPGRKVQLAVFGVWWVLFGVACLYAVVVSRLGRRAPALEHEMQS